jgi:hypothetical protein
VLCLKTAWDRNSYKRSVLSPCSAFEKVSPVLEGIHYSKEFLIVDFVVDFSGRELPRIKRNWMKLSVYAHL